MREFAPVEFVLDRKRATADEAMQNDMLSIQTNMRFLIEYLKNNSLSFAKIARNMVKMLSLVLTAQNTTKISDSLPTNIPDRNTVFEHLRALHELSKNAFSRDAIREIQSSFSGHCIKEAAQVLASANQQFILLQYDPKLDKQKIEGRKRQAEEQYEQVSKFCKRHRIK